MRDRYNKIAGQPLDIMSLTSDLTNDASPRFLLEVAGSETNDVFAAQPAEVVLNHGRRLLDDANTYFSAPECGKALSGTYQTSDEAGCL